MRVTNPDNVAEVFEHPRDAEFIAWAESAPKRCLIISDDSVRFEAFSSPFEFLAWLRHVVPDKKELLESFTRLAVEKWETEFKAKIPESRRKP